MLLNEWLAIYTISLNLLKYDFKKTTRTDLELPQGRKDAMKKLASFRPYGKTYLGGKHF